MQVRSYIKKHWSTILILTLVALLMIPQTGMPIKVFVNRLISFSPSEISEEKQIQLKNYHWKLQDLEGEPIDFAISEGSVSIVNLWATWCAPCVAEMPSFQDLYNDYGERVDFYFVSMESEEKLQSFLTKKGHDLPVFIPKQGLPDAFSAHSFPTTYLIAKDGKIVIDKAGAADWNSKEVRSLLDRLLLE